MSYEIELTDDGQPLALLRAIDRGEPLLAFPRPLLVSCIADAEVAGREEGIAIEAFADDIHQAFALMRKGGFEDVLLLHEPDDPLQDDGFFDDFPHRSLLREIQDPFLRRLGAQTMMNVVTDSSDVLRDEAGRSRWRILVAWEAEPPMHGFSFSILCEVSRAE